MNLLNHHITEGEYRAMLEDQEYACKLCRRKFASKPHIDHDHNCCDKPHSCGKCIRGLLCPNCNCRVLGVFCQEGSRGVEHGVAMAKNLITYMRNGGQVRAGLPAPWEDEPGWR
jgi:hypothetical protein